MIKTVLGLAAAAAVALTPVGLALAGAGSAAAAPLPPTSKLSVRPVHADGSAVAGYQVHAEQIDGFTCDGPSAVGVSNNIYECGPSAAGTVACWKSAQHTVLCLRDPHVKDLARITYSGTLKNVAAPTVRVPQALTLYGGQTCLIRDGGAWAPINGHPNYYGSYTCTGGDLYGGTKDQGIDMSKSPWQVTELSYYNNGKQHLTTYEVAHSYYVGTAS